MAPQLLVLLGEAKKERARAGLRPVQGLGPRSGPGLPPAPGGEEQDLGSPPFTGGSWMGSLKRSFVWTALINAIKNTKTRRVLATRSFPGASRRRMRAEHKHGAVGAPGLAAILCHFGFGWGSLFIWGRLLGFWGSLGFVGHYWGLAPPSCPVTICKMVSGGAFTEHSRRGIPPSTHPLDFS